MLDVKPGDWIAYRHTYPIPADGQESGETIRLAVVTHTQKINVPDYSDTKYWDTSKTRDVVRAWYYGGSTTEDEIIEVRRG
jgi:hypothetical protein